MTCWFSEWFLVSSNYLEVARGFMWSNQIINKFIFIWQFWSTVKMNRTRCQLLQPAFHLRACKCYVALVLNLKCCCSPSVISRFVFSQSLFRARAFLVKQTKGNPALRLHNFISVSFIKGSQIVVRTQFKVSVIPSIHFSNHWTIKIRDKQFIALFAKECGQLT